MAAEQGTNQSVERAAAVLRALAEGRPERRVSDVAAGAGLGASTASRLLATLEQLDLVERDPVSGLYRLSLGTVSLAAVALNADPVHRASRMVLQALAARTGLGANVGIRRGGELMFLANFEGARTPRAYTQAGHTAPLHATAMGKCLLSRMTGAERRDLLGPDLEAPTEHTITSHDRLDSVVDEVRRTGYATEAEERALGRASVAAPVRDAADQVVAAVSLWGPASLLAEENEGAGRSGDLTRQVIEAADAVSQALGAH
ncbi:IclR family transcriptional regulator [Streptomyces sp. NBC_00669]|uniref:IclR family transcriptional regulator n=1 Tax=unclassified Streptomyces TaxID=2593676 RepID=UPI002E3730A3|nr:IclR family transcriptional regulator [Streptomyces sp. NBC_00669]